jgi:hypothetical protein
MARNGQDGWTEEQLAILRREWRAGTPTADIATTLNRTATAVKRKAEALKIHRGANYTRTVKQIDAATPEVLDGWKAGLSVKAIAAAHGKSEHAVVLMASYHKARRPAGHKREQRSAGSNQSAAF